MPAAEFSVIFSWMIIGFPEELFEDSFDMLLVISEIFDDPSDILDDPSEIFDEIFDELFFSALIEIFSVEIFSD
jgi:hypothetical protein